MSDKERLGKPDPADGKFRPENNWRKYETSNHLSSSAAGERVAPNVNVPREFINNVWKVGDEVTNILIKKQADYGPYNISRAPGGALNGLIVRIHDKISRILHLTKTEVDPQNESLRDSYVDLANYALIALMVLDGTWPKE